MKTITNEQRIMENEKWRNIPLFLFLFSFFISIASCDSNDESHLNGDSQAVQFTGSTIGSTPQTRVSGTNWDGAEVFGIYMLKNEDITIVEGAANMKYTTDSNGKFSPATGQEIHYPEDGSKVDFVAYYPYQESLTDNIYKVDVSKQDDANTIIDLLYSKDATNKSKTSATVAMTFKHRLTKLTIKTVAGDGLTEGELTGLGVTIKGMPMTADFNLLNNSFSDVEGVADISPKEGTSNKEYSAILIPQNKKADSKVSFAVANIGTFHWDLSAINFEEGNHYTYTITIGRTGISVSVGNITTWEGTSNTETGTITMPVIETVLIKAGSFQMGSPDSDTQSFANEQPRHWVTLTQDYRMSKYEITNAQYAVFLNAVGVVADGKYQTATNVKRVLIYSHTYGLKYENNKWMSQAGYENHPVNNVTWYGATEFATWLGGSLPTEAQWEYACRAGTETIYSFADNEILDDYAWFYDNNGELGSPTYGTKGVGFKNPNLWGLYDMHGNVFEWCIDHWDGNNNYPTTADTKDKAVVDPTGSISGSCRVIRGGRWDSSARNCRSAFRYNYTPDYRSGSVGFRVVFPLSSL